MLLLFLIYMVGHCLIILAVKVYRITLHVKGLYEIYFCRSVRANKVLLTNYKK